MEKRRILTIDDNAVNLASIEKKLEDEYEVVPMLTGKRAIKYLYCEKVDLILLDVQMPVMDGVETLREIRKIDGGAEIPVIFLSATQDEEAEEEGAKLGIIDYIIKPVDGDDLKRKIRRALQN